MDGECIGRERGVENSWLLSCHWNLKGERAYECVVCYVCVFQVTGCSSEVGHALCHALKSQCDEKGRHVYRIFAADRKAEDLADLEHAGFETLCMDVTVCRSVAAAVEYVVEVAGRIDVAICDAGVMTSGPIIEQQVDSALRVLDINVLGFMRVAQVDLNLNIHSHFCSFLL